MDQSKFTKLTVDQEKNIRGGFAISTAISCLAALVTVATKIVTLVKAAKAKKGEVSSTGSTKWDNTEPKATEAPKKIVYQPVYLSY
ncbi:hypothetical protein [Mycoplasmopsis primatum]|uniref:hypothetical protein n=1 Tax=Mycoplasmopsis primatum TaxID=55604 RepID=UPI0004952055|nr:hypothetical protein [Mycoplasmopsis primatum]